MITKPLVLVDVMLQLLLPSRLEPRRSRVCGITVESLVGLTCDEAVLIDEPPSGGGSILHAVVGGGLDVEAATTTAVLQT